MKVQIVLTLNRDERRVFDAVGRWQPGPDDVEAFRGVESRMRSLARAFPEAEFPPPADGEHTAYDSAHRALNTVADGGQVSVKMLWRITAYCRAAADYYVDEAAWLRSEVAANADKLAVSGTAEAIANLAVSLADLRDDARADMAAAADAAAYLIGYAMQRRGPGEADVAADLDACRQGVRS